MGLTPPSYQYSPDAPDDDRQKAGRVQRAVWSWYAAAIAKLQPVDVLVVNGDAIDGKGKKSGGTEEIEADRLKQVEIARRCLEIVKAKRVFMTYGTPYHTGEEGEDFDAILADKMSAEIHSHLFLKIYKTVFDIKHHLSGSGVPHIRYTAIAREGLWNQVWSMNDVQPRADVVIRSHVHFYRCGDDGRQLLVITPALQGFGSKYGARRCSGVVDIGFISFDVFPHGKRMRKHLFPLGTLADTVIEV